MSVITTSPCGICISPGESACEEVLVWRDGQTMATSNRAGVPTAHTSTPPPRPALWLRMSVPVGNAVQLAGLASGAVLLYLAARAQSAAVGIRVALLLIGFAVIYVCCHALAHYVVGRLGGIRFRGYGLRGTDHPENYPPGMRQLMIVMPFFTAVTEKASMQRASRWAKALMFAAGESSTAVCTLVASFYAWQAGIPGGQLLFIIMVVFNTFSTIMTAMVPRGDYAKAWRALRG